MKGTWVSRTRVPCEPESKELGYDTDIFAKNWIKTVPEFEELEYLQKYPSPLNSGMV